MGKQFFAAAMIALVVIIGAFSIMTVFKEMSELHQKEFRTILLKLEEPRCTYFYYYRIKAWYGKVPTMTVTPARLSVEEARIDSVEIMEDHSSFFYAEPDSIQFFFTTDSQCQK